MTDDASWVEDVRRWCVAGRRATAASPESALDDDAMAIGYEAAHPALLAHHWPDAPTRFAETV